MEKLIITGRYFFAIGIIGLGIEHFIFQDFIMARAPAWPDSIPGKLVWAYLSGVIFILIGLTILLKLKVRLVSVLAGSLIFLWALIRHIPLVASDTFLSGAWTSAGKALVFIGGFLVIAAVSTREETFRAPRHLLQFINLENELIILGRFCLAFFLILTGIQHFMFIEFVASLIPQWFPGDPVFWTYFAGIALISGGLGLVITQTSYLAALLSGIMIFSWFWIVHLPRTMVSQSDGIAIFEALAFSGILFVIAGYLSKNQNRKSIPAFS